MIWRLHLSGRHKLSLSTAFPLDLLVCAVSITRVVAFKQVDHRDVTYTEVLASVLTVIEHHVGIVYACLPASWALLSRFLALLEYGSKRGLKSDSTTGSHAVQLPRYGTKNRA